MSGIRWTTGVGIAVGGVSGAVAALLGAVSSSSPPVEAPAAIQAPAAPSVDLPVAAAAAALPSASAAPAIAASIAAASVAAPAASAPAAPSTVVARAPSPAVGAAPALELPTTRDGLLRAEMLCDQKKDFDECARAAESLEKGTTASADPEQAKRFRKIALTHLVTQCESGAPHACFVLAAKYRAGTELTASTVRAETLEQRGLELCKKRTGPECPAP